MLERVKLSEWAAPIVTVPNDGRIRICGDYKVTTNPCLDVDIYLLPDLKSFLPHFPEGAKIYHD